MDRDGGASQAVDAQARARQVSEWERGGLVVGEEDGGVQGQEGVGVVVKGPIHGHARGGQVVDAHVRY